MKKRIHPTRMPVPDAMPAGGRGDAPAANKAALVAENETPTTRNAPSSAKRFAWLVHLRHRMAEHSIQVHLSGLYLLVLLVSTVMSGALYRELYADVALDRVREASLQTLDSIRANLDTVLRNANNTSKMILSDSDLQALLATGDLYSDFRLQGRIRSFLYKVLQDAPDIDSLYLFDNAGNQYAISRRSRQDPPQIVLGETEWYRTALAAKGAYVLRLNGGGDFPGDEEGNLVSLIRSVRDINTTEPIGTLVINLSETAFHQAFEAISRQYASGFFLLDETGASMLHSAPLSEAWRERLTPLFAAGPSGAEEVSLEGTPYLVSFLRESTHGWTLISLVPQSRLSSENKPVFLTGFIVIGLNGLLLFIGLMLVSRMITTPISKLLASMRQVEAGVLEPWDIHAGNREIRQLRDSYNRMMERLRQLLQRVVVEQQTKRKHELNAMQAQIKPHFLYNTLDSINALALMGDGETVVRMVDALGIYYRLSLGRGREVVTVEDETEMVRQYLNIQKIRYADLFTCEYDLDEAAGKLPLLKLVLQPLVENALYHGIRASGRKGSLRLVTRREKDCVRIDICDDGTGMAPVLIRQALAPTSLDSMDKPMGDVRAGNNGNGTGTEAASGNGAGSMAASGNGAGSMAASGNGAGTGASSGNDAGSGFGLRGTVERLRIFYGREDVITIHSEPDRGTCVTLRIPAGDARFVNGTERILNGATPDGHGTLQEETDREDNA